MNSREWTISFISQTAIAELTGIRTAGQQSKKLGLTGFRSPFHTRMPDLAESLDTCAKFESLRLFPTRNQQPRTMAACPLSSKVGLPPYWHRQGKMANPDTLSEFPPRCGAGLTASNIERPTSNSEQRNRESENGEPKTRPCGVATKRQKDSRKGKGCTRRFCLSRGTTLVVQVVFGPMRGGQLSRIRTFWVSDCLSA